MASSASSVSSGSSSSSSETSSGSRYLLPAEADSHKFYDPSLDKMFLSLMKYPENQLCANCKSEGPQYVCTHFASFVCKTCSDIHQEYGHMVKSVSDKFTFEEVYALLNTGNKQWAECELEIPDSSDVVGIRKFIRLRYVDGRSSDNDAEAYMLEAEDKRMEARSKERVERIEAARKEEEGSSGKKRKIEEVEGLREIPDEVIIENLPNLSLPLNEFIKKLRDLTRVTVGICETSKPLNPIVTLDEFRHLRQPYPWRELNIEQMAEKGFNTVEGKVLCLECGAVSTAYVDWREAWVKATSFMFANLITFGEELYSNWSPPADNHFECGSCFKLKMVPSVTTTMEVNWVFLFLTNMVSHVPDRVLEEYIRSRGILLSSQPSKKELMFRFHIYMLQKLDPKGGWAFLQVGEVRDDERSK